MTHRSYGRYATIGIATPQANPTAEPEIAELMPKDTSILATRSVATGSPRERLQSYFDDLPTALASFGGLQLDAFGFACTASSYLLAPGQEAAATAGLHARFGFPVITAAQAVQRALERLNIKRLLIGSPYPQWIHELCLQHWQGLGFEVVAAVSAQPAMDDTIAIYGLDPDPVADHFTLQFTDQHADHGADALLITGTGMPSLPVIPRLKESLNIPVLSSNLCLAWACLDSVHPGDAPAEKVLARCLP